MDLATFLHDSISEDFPYDEITDVVDGTKGSINTKEFTVKSLENNVFSKVIIDTPLQITVVTDSTYVPQSKTLRFSDSRFILPILSSYISQSFDGLPRISVGSEGGM